MIKGFSLAETLITLGIIGIVAVLTIPNMITNYQKKITAQKLKKTYSEVSQAVRMAENENGELSGWDIKRSCETAFDEYMLPNIKVSKKKTANPILTYYESSGNRETGLRIVGSSSASYTLLSGAEIIVSKGKCSEMIEIIVDLNGYKKKPNKFGRDAFFMAFSPERGFVLHSQNDGEHHAVHRTRNALLNGPSNFRYQCNKQGRGMWCGALIQADGWQISKDYPW
ncbi:MAG: type II secretion system GspH family protein [Muribaculaceae bacterium]|nr:type II secretion system GspH family protein [Muribaculaceae bacterium]